MTGAGYDTTTGGDHAVGLADKLQAAAGAATLLTWRQSANASDRWAGITFALRPAPANIPPTVSLTSPAGGATFTAPANITLSATAADTDGTITKVEFFHGGTNLIATVTSAPYTFSWTNVAAASYSLTAKATDNLTATTTSAPVNITVGQQAAALHFIHTDHLNTPRLITNNAGQAVWRWDQADPFGGDIPNENPSGLGTFTCNLRLPGQYFDKETNLHYNYFRDYDPAIGRYVQSDPIGLLGGINTYAYVHGDPLRFADPDGLFDPAGWPVTQTVATAVGATAATVTAVVAGVGLALFPSSIAEDEEIRPEDRPWRKRDRWHVYVRCAVNKQANCENCPDTIGGHAFGPTFPTAFARAQMDANRNLGFIGARNCQARHCQPVACFENGRQVECPKSGR